MSEEAGADVVWYLETELGHSALWGRTFEGGFLDSKEDVDPRGFSCSVDALRKVQADVDQSDGVNDHNQPGWQRALPTVTSVLEN